MSAQRPSRPGVPLAAQQPFSVLVVCTGNVCRSPQAERLLLARRDAAASAAGPPGIRSALLFSSAGTAALVGSPMTPEALAETIARGGSDSPHRARQVTEAMLTGADLVLTMERAQRAAVVGMVPRSSRTTFTLRELARLLADLVASGGAEIAAGDGGLPAVLRSLVPQVAARRGFAVPPADPAADDIIDPYGRTAAVYHQSADQVQAGTDAVWRHAALLLAGGAHG